MPKKEIAYWQEQPPVDKGIYGWDSFWEMDVKSVLNLNGWENLEHAMENGGLKIADKDGKVTDVNGYWSFKNNEFSASEEMVQASLEGRLFVVNSDDQSVRQIKAVRANVGGYEVKAGRAMSKMPSVVNGEQPVEDQPSVEDAEEKEFFEKKKQKPAAKKRIVLNAPKNEDRKPERPSLWVRIVHAIFGGYKKEMAAYKKALQEYENKQRQGNEPVDADTAQAEEKKSQVEAKKQPHTLVPHEEKNVNQFLTYTKDLTEKMYDVSITSKVYMEEKQFAALAVMALASPDLKIDIEGKHQVEVRKNTPERYFKKALEGNYEEREVGTDRSITTGFIREGARAVSEAIKKADNGDMSDLTKLIVDGVKMNNKMIQAQKPINDNFSRGVELNAQAMFVAGKDTALLENVMKELGDEELQKMEVFFNIDKMRKAALESQQNLVDMYSGKKEMDKQAEKKALVNVIHFSAVEKQFIAGTLDMGTYADETRINEINETLAKNEGVQLSGEDLVAMVKDPDKMATLYTNAIENAQNGKVSGNEMSLNKELKKDTVKQNEGMSIGMNS